MAGPLDMVLSLLGNAAAGLNPQLGAAVKVGTAAFQNRDKLIAGGKALTEAFNSFKEANGGTAPADAEAKHDAMVASVTAHAKQTFDRAEGR